MNDSWQFVYLDTVIRSRCKWIFLPLFFSSLFGCSQQADTNESKELMKSLAAKVAVLEDKVTKNENAFQSMKYFLRLQREQWKAGEFDPTDSSFQRIDADGVGSFAVSIKDVRQVGDGLRVKINLGNLTAATIAGAKLNLKYGPRAPDVNAEGFSEKYDAWVKSLRTREHSVSANLIEGSWNPVEVDLPNIQQNQFGYLELSILTSKIMLNRGH